MKHEMVSSWEFSAVRSYGFCNTIENKGGIPYAVGHRVLFLYGHRTPWPPHTRYKEKQSRVAPSSPTRGQLEVIRFVFSFALTLGCIYVSYCRLHCSTPGCEDLDDN